jgi:hypothetical protein
LKCANKWHDGLPIILLIGIAKNWADDATCAALTPRRDIAFLKRESAATSRLRKQPKIK